MQRPTVLAFLTVLSVSFAMPARASAQAGAESVVRLEAIPASVVVMTGEEVPFEVRALDAQGRVVADAEVRTVAPRAAGRVRGGTVRGRTAGEYEIVVTLLTPPGFEGTAPSLRVPLTVLAPEVATVEVAAEPGRLYQGTTLRHTATANQTDGSVRPSPVVSWSSSDPSVATVDRFGYVTATGTGAVTIRADVDGTAGTAAYDVAPFPAVSLDITGLADEVRTGDVQHAHRGGARRLRRGRRGRAGDLDPHGRARRGAHRPQRARADLAGPLRRGRARRLHGGRQRGPAGRARDPAGRTPRRRCAR